MNFSEQCFRIFEQATEAYHVTDNVDATVHNPYAVKSIEFYLYLKNWIDAVQWHLEDIIRNPEIDPVEALAIKRRIDKSAMPHRMANLFRCWRKPASAVLWWSI